MRVKVIKNESPTDRQVWVFWFTVGYESRIVLDGYRKESRESTRKRTWFCSKAYSRLDQRSILTSLRLAAKDIPIPDDVQSDVYAFIDKKIRKSGIERQHDPF